MPEWNADDYHANSRLQEYLAEQHLSWLPLAGWERVLDIGCGDGKITAAIAGRIATGSVVGVDPSSKMIEYASGHYVSGKCPNVSFVVGDVRNLPFEAEFDRAVSFNALHWVHEGDAALASIRRALKLGGQAFLEFVPGGNRKGSDYLVGELCATPRWKEYFVGFVDPFAHFLPDEYAAMAERAGFTVERIESEEAEWDFGSRQAFLGFFRTTCYPWTHRLPEELHAEFHESALNLYAERNGSDSVMRFLQMEVVLRAM